MGDTAQLGEIRQHAITLLARREHGRFELQRKLAAKGYDAEAIFLVLDSLEGERLQSDARYCESYIRSRVRKGYGPNRIRMELQEKRLDSTLINEYIYLDEWDWHQLAIEVRRKRFGELSGGDIKARAKQLRFLQYRGFDSEQINAAMRQSD